MEKRDARKLPRAAQEEMRRQTMRMREELNLTWKEIARVVGVSIRTIFTWSRRYALDGESGLKSRKREQGGIGAKNRGFLMKSLYQLPERVRSYFNHAKVRYAAM